MEAQALPREAAVRRPGTVSPRMLGMATDARLVALVRDGNGAAFEAIYDRYQAQIMSFCRHMLADPEEAADAVQHTFLAAYNAIISSDKAILLRAWLFTIARNRCYSVLRARREMPASELIEPSTEGLAAQVQRREDLRQLLADMRKLPDDQRAALVLAELGTLSHQEIASALGVPPAKVKALIFQARESLIADRTARDTDCSEIRQQLSTLRGGALRRGNLRRHLSECQGCREFRSQVEGQRRSIAAILPVAPSLALKDAILGGVSGSGSAAGAVAGSGLIASTAIKGIALKGAIGAALAMLGIGGTIVAVHAWGTHHHPRATPASSVLAAEAHGTKVALTHTHHVNSHSRHAAAAGGHAARHGAGRDAHLQRSTLAARDYHAASVRTVRSTHHVAAASVTRHPSAPRPAVTAPSAPAVPAPPAPSAAQPTSGERHHGHDGGGGQGQLQGQGDSSSQGQGDGPGQGGGQPGGGQGQGHGQGQGQGDQGGGHHQGGGGDGGGSQGH